VLPGKAAFVETKIGTVERTLTSVYLCIVATVIVLAGVTRAIAPGALTKMRDAGITWVLEFAK